MTDYITITQQNDEIKEKLLYAIIRKPQEGKTFICLQNIRQNPNCLHIIMTMNTINSNNQFFERANNQFPNRLCVFNSKANPKEMKRYSHCKQVHQLGKVINRNGKNIIVMCCHPKRFNSSLLELIDLLSDSRSFHKKIIIHIDEAHAYIPRYRDKIYQVNQYEIVERLYLYSATPFNIWLPRDSKQEERDQLYQSIFIVDIERDFGIKKSEHYFGVKDCNLYIINNIPLISTDIPEHLVQHWGSPKQRQNPASHSWYGEKFPFSLGNEHAFLSYTKHTLTLLKNQYICDHTFSYNFIPAYQRKLTHYAVMFQVLKIYPSAIVIVINGNGTTGYLKDTTSNLIKCVPLPKHNEPSIQIENFIKPYPNRPVFITGFICVGMSVTLINENIGNFDNVLLSHSHYLHTSEILYQLCRFLFNYIGWDFPDNRKKTNLFLENQAIYKRCRDYEKQIDKIDTKMSGSVRTLDEVRGDIPMKKKKMPKEKKYDRLEPFVKKPLLKPRTFQVTDPEEVEKQKAKAIQCYTEWMGHPPSNRSMPSLNRDGLYECSITGKREVQYGQEEWRKKMKNWRWGANYQLVYNQFKYARIYVVYDEEDKSEYSWMVRRMEIQNTPECLRVWNEIEQHR